MDAGDDGQDQEEYRQEDMDLSEVSSGEDGAEENDAHPDNWGLGIGRRFINILRDRTGAWVVRDFRPLPEDSSPGPDDEFSENLANSLAESLSRTPPANEVDETAGSSQAHNFDTELPTNHSYLGRMESVSGMEYYEPGKRYKIHVCYHHSIIFPGQKLPMILSSNQAFLLIAQSDEHSVGLVFPPIGGVQYGVTCQVYEKNVKSPAWRTDLRAILRAHQRFRVCTKTQVLPPIFMRDVLEVEVEILPELSLGHPLSGHFRGSLEKFLPHSERVRLLYSTPGHGHYLSMSNTTLGRS
uniref:Uncharacterized protein n=1 Tax=Lutzomyia longipalpis TaxID=7200 RepID=A0A1B0CDH0_LUTLO